MTGDEEWAFEGRMISRKAHAARDPQQSSEVDLPLSASTNDHTRLYAHRRGETANRIRCTISY